MILIDRGRASAPRALSNGGAAHLKAVIEPSANAGTLTANHFDRSIYASEEVKERLWKMQYYKCCFFEHKYEKKYSTVEHFRPKTEASDDVRNRGKKRVGY